MKLKISGLFLLLTVLLQAQVFNRPIFITANQTDPAVMRAHGAIYIAFNSSENQTTYLPAVYKLDANGDLLATDTIGSPSVTGWNHPLGYLFPENFLVLKDSSFLLYGNYVRRL
ncbi:MAG: hypothetical protein U5L96_14015 [Owenweeksia sp.]|nr:hypothetical protein [Owenweeksia sp.]